MMFVFVFSVSDILAERRWISFLVSLFSRGQLRVDLQVAFKSSGDIERRELQETWKRSMYGIGSRDVSGRGPYELYTRLDPPSIIVFCSVLVAQINRDSEVFALYACH